MREAWYRKAMQRYTGIVHEMKQRELKTKGRPPYVLETQWKRWVEHWNHPDTIIKSQKASTSRNSNPRLHTGGSISMEETGEKMAIDLKRAATPIEIFRRTHLTNYSEITTAEDPTTVDSKWVDSAAENFQARYHAAYNDRLIALRAEIGEDVDEVPREQQIVIFHALTPLNAKGCAYPGGNLPDDTGSSATQRRRLMMSGSNSYTSDSVATEELQARLIAMQEEVQRVKVQAEEISRRSEAERQEIENEREAHRREIEEEREMHRRQIEEERQDHLRHIEDERRHDREKREAFELRLLQVEQRLSQAPPPHPLS